MDTSSLSTFHDDGSKFFTPTQTLTDLADPTADRSKMTLAETEAQVAPGLENSRSLVNSILLVLTVTLAMVVNVRGSTSL